jgi:predicted nucleic acid-binding protein
MVLVDTSVWIAHFRGQVRELAPLLENGEVLCHPFVIGELACGNFKNRDRIFDLLKALEQVEIADDSEVLQFLESNKLFGRGLGWIDGNLLASGLITGVRLWTLDQRLKKIAEEMNLAF